MRKRITAVLIASFVMLALGACSGSGSGKNQPEGLYMIDYFCHEDGEYAKDLNETTWDYGYPTTEVEKLYAWKETIWCDISADGTGFMHREQLDEGDITVDAKAGTVEYNGITYDDFKYDPGNDVFWFGNKGDDFFYHLRSCTQEEIDDVFAGRGGSVAMDKAEVGDLVCIGSYDTFPYNEETEPLFWRVLDKQDGKLLILCDKLIDSYAFNTDPTQQIDDSVTWENSSVREFLNNDFLDKMFTDEEKALIQTAHVENKQANDKLLEQWGSWEDRDGKPYSWQTKQERGDDPDTEDKVFLLSYQEILKYFGEPTEDYDGDGGYPFDAMKANPKWKALVTQTVDYNAIGYYDHENYCGAWMTRTLSSSNGTMITYITSEGEVFNNYTFDPMFIRPAMWVSIDNQTK